MSASARPAQPAQPARYIPLPRRMRYESKSEPIMRLAVPERQLLSVRRQPPQLLHYAAPHCIADKLGLIVEAQFAHEVLAVGLGGPWADSEAAGDIVGAQAFG
jgi:hypothetical protein